MDICSTVVAVQVIAPPKEPTGAPNSGLFRLRRGRCHGMQAGQDRGLQFAVLGMVWSTDQFYGQLPLVLGDETLVGLPGLPIATIGPNGPAWVSADWRGSTTAAAGADPWGHRPADPAAAGEGPQLGFLGEVEIGGGLVWLRNRIYDPATHAFLSRDPLAGSLSRPGGWANPYQYAENDPVGKLDPSGLKAVTAAQAAQQMQGWK